MKVLYTATKSIEIPEGVDPHEFAASLDIQGYAVTNEPAVKEFGDKYLK